MATINPFTVDDDNPFEAVEERTAQSNPWSTSSQSAYNTTTTTTASRQPSKNWGNDAPTRPAPPPPTTNRYGSSSSNDKSTRETDLDKREAELKLREARLAERERRIGDFNPPNWPRFRPMIYHDIEKDIPEGGRWLVKRVYGAWYLAVTAYLINFIAAFSCLVTKAEAGGGTFGLALIIFLIGTPVSFVFWYRPLYTGVKTDSSISFFFFWINYGFHLGISALLAVGIPGWGGAGVILCLAQLSKNVVSGVLCGVASGVLIFQVVYGLWQIKAASAFYRSKGMSVEKARNEAVAGIASSKVGRDLAGQAIKTAAQNELSRV